MKKHTFFTLQTTPWDPESPEYEPRKEFPSSKSHPMSFQTVEQSRDRGRHHQKCKNFCIDANGSE